VPGVPLRRRLFLLAAAGIVPLVVMSGIGLYALAQQQRIQAEPNMLSARLIDLLNVRRSRAAVAEPAP